MFCGIATERDVLKSAADAFEHGYGPWIVTDACASDAGPEIHESGLTVARRLIGRNQLIPTTTRSNPSPQPKPADDVRHRPGHRRRRAPCPG